MDDDVVRVSRLIGRTDAAAISERHFAATSEGRERSDDRRCGFVDLVDDEDTTELNGADEGRVD